MDYEISVEDGIVLVILSGKATPEDYSKATKAIFSLPEAKPGMKVLVEYERLDLAHVGGTDVLTYVLPIMLQLVPHRKIIKSIKIACVSSKQIEYGLGRIWQTFMESLNDMQIRIFYTFEEAMHWLSVPDQES